MKAKIEMLNDRGDVTETVEEVSVCSGAPECGSEEPLFCEECGTTATPLSRVYVWTSGSGLEYFACGACISRDAYARLVLTEE